MFCFDNTILWQHFTVYTTSVHWDTQQFFCGFICNICIYTILKNLTISCIIYRPTTILTTVSVKVSRLGPKCNEWVNQMFIWKHKFRGAQGEQSWDNSNQMEENYASRGRRSGEQAQSVTKPGRRMGRRPDQKTVERAIRVKGLKAGQYQR